MKNYRMVIKSSSWYCHEKNRDIIFLPYCPALGASLPQEVWKKRERNQWNITFKLNKHLLLLYHFLYRMLDQDIFASTHQTQPWWWSPSSAWTAPTGWYHGINWPPSTNPKSTHSWASTWQDPTSPILPHHRLPASPPHHPPRAPSMKTIRTKATGWEMIKIILTTVLTCRCKRRCRFLYLNHCNHCR